VLYIFFSEFFKTKSIQLHLWLMGTCAWFPLFENRSQFTMNHAMHDMYPFPAWFFSLRYVSPTWPYDKQVIYRVTKQVIFWNIWLKTIKQASTPTMVLFFLKKCQITIRLNLSNPKYIVSVISLFSTLSPNFYFLIIWFRIWLFERTIFFRPQNQQNNW
jgi:hypothetical protein